MKRLFIHFPFLSALACFLISCEGTSETVDVKPDQPIDETKHEIITLGGGCYWCVEAVFQQLPGVASATSGFMGGHIPDPIMRQVSGGRHGTGGWAPAGDRYSRIRSCKMQLVSGSRAQSARGAISML